MSVLVYVENVQGKFKKSNFEVIAYSKAIADQLHTDLITVSIGDVDQTSLDSLGKYGASRVLHIMNDQLKFFVNQAYASILAEVAQAMQANVLVLANSFSGKGLAPRIAVKLEAGLVDGAVELPILGNNSFSVKKIAFSGKAFVSVSITSEIKIITLNQNSYPIQEFNSTVTIENFVPTNKEADFKAVVKEIVKTMNKIALPEATRVVSAGRGMKGPENWAMIEALADVLGAATACSKPVSDAGWRPHEEHVGQTGIVISPDLYVAIGISGAIQHLAGVSSSKTIVVINNDPEAPFFKVADYGILGDAFKIVPQLTKAIQAFHQMT